MKRAGVISICAALAVLSGACGRHSSSLEEKNTERKNIVELATHPAPPGSTAAVSVDGCLSVSGDRFMLASLDKDASKTVVYQLVNANDQLRNLVGKEVRVTGEARAGQSTETRAVTPPAPTATSGKPNTEAKVATVEDTKLDTRTLTVASVSVTGDSCTK